LLVATAGLCLLGSGYYGYEQNKKKGPQPLDPNVYVPLTLTEKEQISPDSYRLRLLTKQKMDNFPVPSCLYIKDDTIQVMRPYTPVNSDPYKDGYIDLVVKRYAGGSVSRTLSGFEPNDKVHVRGPMMEEYEYKENSVDEVGMVKYIK
jgi:cytochrome-b5 reductase